MRDLHISMMASRAGISSQHGTINIYGGDITARGAKYCAGIGGGNGCNGGTINIFGGTVRTYGGVDAAGIGGGENGKKIIVK